MDDVVARFEISATMVQSMVSELAETKVRLTQIINGIYGEEGRQTIAEGINDILEQVVVLANTKHNNQYLFGGSATDSAPYV
ncbi:MAG: hypothetical protein ACYSTZ_08155, partial [Planctomycetota bacterium]